MKGLMDDGNKVIAFKQHGDSSKSNHNLYMETFKENIDIQTSRFEEGLANLRTAMGEYLDFSRL
jgi:hypothetical protein